MTDRAIYAVVLAGGSGLRMGREVPKQFLHIDGKSVLQRSIERLKEACPEAKIITVLPREHFAYWKNLCAQDNFDCPQRLVAGGITRFQSVRNALKKVPDGALVMIHDGVRPFASKELICKMIDSVQDALIPVLPLVDTLRWKDPCELELDRSKMLAVQTPQVFKSELVKKAYKQAFRMSFTDDASVAEADGVRIDVIDGERLNIKLTTPDDLLLAEFILKQERANAQ